MFLWTWRQAVFFLVMVTVCAMALTHPLGTTGMGRSSRHCFLLLQF